MENELENLDSQNEEIENADSQNGESEEVDVEALKEENAKLKKTNQGLYEESQKAKGYVRGTDGKWIKPAPKETKEEKTETKPDKKYSLEDIDDIAALSSIPKEDRPEVLDYADRKGIKPAEALNAPIIKIFLKEQEEFRKSAQVQSVVGGKRGSSKASSEDLLNKANQGDLPEDEESIQRLIAIQRAKK